MSTFAPGVGSRGELPPFSPGRRRILRRRGPARRPGAGGNLTPIAPAPDQGVGSSDEARSPAGGLAPERRGGHRRSRLGRGRLSPSSSATRAASAWDARQPEITRSTAIQAPRAVRRIFRRRDRVEPHRHPLALAPALRQAKGPPPEKPGAGEPRTEQEPPADSRPGWSTGRPALREPLGQPRAELGECTNPAAEHECDDPWGPSPRGAGSMLARRGGRLRFAHVSIMGGMPRWFSQRNRGDQVSRSPGARLPGCTLHLPQAGGNSRAGVDSARAPIGQRHPHSRGTSPRLIRRLSQA
jgi:hypothetical protein